MTCSCGWYRHVKCILVTKLSEIGKLGNVRERERERKEVM